MTIGHLRSLEPLIRRQRNAGHHRRAIVEHRRGVAMPPGPFPWRPVIAHLKDAKRGHKSLPADPHLAGETGLDVMEPAGPSTPASGNDGLARDRVVSDLLAPLRILSPWDWALGGNPLEQVTEPWRYAALAVPSATLTSIGALAVARRDVTAA